MRMTQKRDSPLNSKACLVLTLDNNDRVNTLRNKQIPSRGQLYFRLAFLDTE